MQSLTTAEKDMCHDDRVDDMMVGCSRDESWTLIVRKDVRNGFGSVLPSWKNS